MVEWLICNQLVSVRVGVGAPLVNAEVVQTVE